ncbi:DUF6279 family lipoprotein [Pseudomonas sp. JS3066]|uniref:DUF6279 family lipoprotein n=1 Tax=Pseudomonas sp. JS3066 TaxID=3090665 RepID=UPI002E7B94CD|nr:DUF6279 family lipoprotein [Pseudomonas sp. JS3066]WVK94499.1 DUF6279 family lipoprotein [Pseudomonas sp. JS3066]
MSGRTDPFRYLLLAVAIGLLAACSRLDLAYRNLDLVIPWWISNYLTLDDSQQAWMTPRLEKHLAWHCSTQLPEYVAWLEQLDQLSQRPQLTVTDLQGQFAQVRESVNNIAVQVTPTVLGLAKGLSPKQMGELYVAMDERNAELREEHVAPSLKDQVTARSLRMRERVEEWMGPLRASQQARIDTWARRQGDYNRIWAENRESWQKELRNALYGRHASNFPARLTALLQEPDDFWTPDYRKAHPAAETSLAQLLADLFNSADERQRNALREYIGGMISDLKGLECYPR